MTKTEATPAATPPLTKGVCACGNYDVVGKQLADGSYQCPECRRLETAEAQLAIFAADPATAAIFVMAGR